LYFIKGSFNKKRASPSLESSNTPREKDVEDTINKARRQRLRRRKLRHFRAYDTTGTLQH